MVSVRADLERSENGQKNILLARMLEATSGYAAGRGKRVHDDSQQEHSIFRQIVESAIDHAIVTVDLTGKILTWNSGAENLLGFLSSEIIGRDVGTIFTFDDQLAGQALKEMRSALASGRADDTRWLLRKNGSQVYVNGSILPLKDADGRATGFLKIMHDYTDTLAREQSDRANEESLRLILQSATDYAIFTMNADGLIKSWNVGACRLCGYTEAEILGRDARILFTPEERDAGALEWEMRTAEEEGRAENERFHVRKDGTTFWGSGLTMPLRSSKGGFLKVMRDDSERHNKQEFQQTMIRETSHRVKNSLTLVAGMLGMQAKAADEPVIVRALTNARMRVMTIADVHDHLWRQSDVETVNLAEFMGSLCTKLGQTTELHSVETQVDHCDIDADRAIQIALLVNELVTNSFKHAYGQTEGTVLVKLKELPGEILLEVSDNGGGLPADFRLDATERRSLGTRLINGLVQQLQADIEISRGKKGARFEVRIPR